MPPRPLMPPLVESPSAREASSSRVGGHSSPPLPPPMRDEGRSRSASDGDGLPLVKCVLVGDGAVGKSSLLISYSDKDCPVEYVPTVFDNYTVTVTVDGRPVRLQLCDTAGQDELDSLRTLCYADASVFLVCFSVVRRNSFRNVASKWLPEVRRHCHGGVPIILVGTQCDIRYEKELLIGGEQSKQENEKNEKERTVSENEARRMATETGSATYVECSALSKRFVKDVFDSAIFAALDRQGLVEKCRGGGGGLTGIRRSKKYRCRSELWGSSGGGDGKNLKSEKKKCKLFSCICV